MLKILAVGDGDLSLSLALARAYGKHVELTTSVLDSKVDLLQAYQDAPIVELESLNVTIIYCLDATQLHRRYPKNHWDLVLFHHPHLGLGSLDNSEAEHVLRHYRLLCHYLHSARQVSNLVHVCLCGTQPETWRLEEAAKHQGIHLLRKISTTAPFSQVWTQQDVQVAPADSQFAAPRRYRNGKLGSRHFLGKFGYKHRRTEGGRYSGTAADMNVAGSMHFVFQTAQATATKLPMDDPSPSSYACTICHATFSSNLDLNDHLAAPAQPQVTKTTTVETASSINNSLISDVKQPPEKQSLVVSHHQQPLTGPSQDLAVSEEHIGKRLRWFIQHNIKNVSKRQADASIRNGLVLVNGIAALDSSRILTAATIVTVFETTTKSPTGPAVEVLHRQTLKPSSSQFLVVCKPPGMRTKGMFPGTLESAILNQEGKAYASLSKLDTSCPGLCVLVESKNGQGSSKEDDRPLTICHSLTALIHGRVPENWSPNREISVPVKPKWKSKKRKHRDHQNEEEEKEPKEQHADIMQLVPLERTSPDTTSLALSTVCIRTSTTSTEANPSASSICRFLRQQGYPVVGDQYCRKEYLQLKRPIRNRIKDKLCIGCYAVEVRIDGVEEDDGDDDKDNDNDKDKDDSLVTVQKELPDKLSAKYWETNFGQDQETKRGIHIINSVASK